MNSAVPGADASQASQAHRERPQVLLINAFEKLPGENFRDQRYTFLYELLKQRASVSWFSSSFHHWSHSKRSCEMLPAEDRAKIKLIRTLPYKRNVSVRRFVSYIGLSIATLWNLLKLPSPPDCIVCMGPVEQMFLVVMYGRIRSVPVIIDVIDPWPDVYVRAFPARLQWLGRILLTPYFLMSYLTFAMCDRGSAVSQTYLDWAMRRGQRKDRDSFRLYYLGARNEDFMLNEVVESTQSLTCLFAGQFAFSYDIELILRAAKILQESGEDRIRFVLCGSGDKRSEIVDAIKTLTNVQLHGWLSARELNAIGNSCQVGLCCYTASATQSVPTKVFDYLSMGLHVVSSLAGEAETLLASHAIGSSYRAGDVHDFLECLRRIRHSVDFGSAKRASVRRTFDENFDSHVIYNRMVNDFVLPLALRRQQH